jgi:hypothetical protein
LTERDDPRRGDWNSLCGLIVTISEFADSVFQARIWIEGKGPECSSYSEALTQLFDDYRIREFANGKAMEFGFSEDMTRWLALLADKIDAFDASLPTGVSDTDILRRGEWATIVDMAGQFMEAGALDWLAGNCEAFPMFPLRWRNRTIGGVWKNKSE